MTQPTRARHASRSPRAPRSAAEDPPAPRWHSWHPDDGDEVVHGGRGIDVLNLPSLTAASLIGAIRLCGREGQSLSLVIGADGSVTFPDEAGREEAVSGTLTLQGHRLRFFAIRRIVFAAEG